jgi:hypothetical protein
VEELPMGPLFVNWMAMRPGFPQPLFWPFISTNHYSLSPTMRPNGPEWLR